MVNVQSLVENEVLPAAVGVPPTAN